MIPPEKKKSSVACVRDWRDFSEDYYRLPTDGRQWRSQAVLRMRLADYLSTFANGDGTSITVGVERMSDKLGRDYRTTLRLLDDLRKLKALAPKSGLTSEHGTAIREMTMEAFVARHEADLEAEYQAYQMRQTEGTRCDKLRVPDATNSRPDATNWSRVCRTTDLDRTDRHTNRPNKQA